jgi:hypothetical protein
LRTNNKNEYQTYTDIESERKNKMKTEATTSHSLITSFVSSKNIVNKYDKNSPIVKGFMLRLVRLVSTTSVPISTVEKQEFRELISFLDEKIPISVRKELINECLKYLKESKQETILKIKKF